MYKLSTVRLLWFLSLVIPGLHRFYLGKFGSGLLYFFTGGFGHIGTLIDFFILPSMVEEANRSIEYKRVLYQGLPPATRKIKKESIEKVILKTAKKNNGMVTPAEVALNGDISMEKAREYLEILTKKGFAEMRVKTNGVIVFCFPEFMPETMESDFEDF